MRQTTRLAALAVLLAITGASAQPADTPANEEAAAPPDLAALRERVAKLEEENRILREFLSRRGLKVDTIIAAAKNRGDGEAEAETTGGADGDTPSTTAPGGEEKQPVQTFRSLDELLRSFPEEVLPPGENVQWGQLVRDASAQWAKENLAGKRVRVSAFFSRAAAVKAGSQVGGRLGLKIEDDGVLVDMYAGKVTFNRLYQKTTPYRIESTFRFRGHNLSYDISALFPTSMALDLAGRESQPTSSAKRQVEMTLVARIAGVYVDDDTVTVIVDQPEIQNSR